MPDTVSQGKYHFSLHRRLETEDVRLLIRMFSVTRSAPQGLRKWGGERITNIVGPFAGGKTLLMEALIRYLRTDGLNVGCLPETTVGELRPWEVQGEFVHRVSRHEFEELYKAQDLMVAYERRRGLSDVVKTGGLSCQVLKDRAHLPGSRGGGRYDYLLMAINMVAQLELEEVFAPPIPAIVVTTCPDAHAAMQQWRGVHPLDSAGLSSFGVQSDIERIPGVLWWQNHLVPGVEELDEATRRERVIASLLERFEQPLTPFELAHYSPNVGAELLPQTLGEYLKRVVVRDLPINL